MNSGRMFVSKLLPLTSVVSRSALQNGLRQFSTTGVRKGHGWVYRGKEAPPKFNVRFADCCGVFFWWWVSWHVFTDYGHIVGHFDFPDSKSWTDEELGIPPDDAEDP